MFSRSFFQCPHLSLRAELLLRPGVIDSGNIETLKTALLSFTITTIKLALCGDYFMTIN